MQKTQKIYCYVDETGQDTEGKLFIVVAVVVDDERDELNRYLQEAETASGIRKKKWVRAKGATDSRNQYLEAVGTGDFKSKIFFSIYEHTGTGAFEQLTVLTIAQAVNRYREKHGVGDDYRVSITIDGLKLPEGARVGKSLRDLGIRPRKVRGGRDESEPILRLADRIAGLVRESHEGREAYMVIQKQLERRGIIKKLP